MGREKKKEEATCFAQKKLIKATTVAQEHHRWKQRKTKGKATTLLSLSLAAAVLLALIRFGKFSEVPVPPGLFLFPPTVFFRLLPSVGYHAFPSSSPLLPYHSLSSRLFLAGGSFVNASRSYSSQGCFRKARSHCFPRGRFPRHRSVTGHVRSSRVPECEEDIRVPVSLQRFVTRCPGCDGLALGVPGKQFPVFLPGREGFICRVICT